MTTFADVVSEMVGEALGSVTTTAAISELLENAEKAVTDMVRAGLAENRLLEIVENYADLRAGGIGVIEAAEAAVGEFDFDDEEEDDYEDEDDQDPNDE